MNEALAIVDVETTGTSAQYHRIIEIAVLRVEGWKVVDSFHSLVNPGRNLSPVIEGITGITDAELATAPRFEEIHKELSRLLEGALFVAHNARFDYSFLRGEFARMGKAFQAKCLCTVKLSRALFPQFRHHDLGSLILRHGLTCDQRHRAMGDARVLLDFLRQLRKQEGDARLKDAFRGLLKSTRIPSGLDRDAVDALPESPGVYLFYGMSGELLYVGKSVNIRDRVLGHFSSQREMDMCKQVTRVEAQPTAGELGALLLELHLIKERRPIYNQVSRSKKPLVVARKEITREGYARLTLADGDFISPADATSIMAVFKTRSQALRYLAEAAKTHALCSKLLGIEQSRSYCFGYQLKRCLGACVGEEPAEIYNNRFEEAFSRRRVVTWPFDGGILVREEEGTGGSGEAFLVDQWCLVSSFRYSDVGHGPLIRGGHTFDYDSYRVLAKYILDRRNRRSIRAISRREMEILLADGAL